MKKRTWIVAAAIGAAVAAGGVAGALIASPAVALGASNFGGGSGLIADTTPSHQNGPHSAGNCTEQALTGDTASKVTAAAKAAVPGATIERVETNCDDATPYEAHVTKSDGTHATVLVDKDFKVTKVTTCPGGAHNGRRGAGTTTTTTSNANA